VWYHAGMSATPETTLDVTGLPPAVIADLQRLVDTLRTAPPPSTTVRPSLRGVFAIEGKDVPKEVIDEARRELWANFPRDFPTPEGA
jgi:hypothetical protein